MKAHDAKQPSRMHHKRSVIGIKPSQADPDVVRRVRDEVLYILKRAEGISLNMLLELLCSEFKDATSTELAMALAQLIRENQVRIGAAGKTPRLLHS